MRKLVVPLVLLAAISVAGSAQAAISPSTTLQLSSERVLYGNPLTLSGRVSTHRSGQRVGVLVHPMGAVTRTITATTRAGGYWSIRTSPSRYTSYRARIGVTTTVAKTVGVQPLVAIDELGNGKIWVRVTGARSFGGSEVALQRLQANGIWETVLKAPLGPKSGATFQTTLPSSTVRISMSVNQAGAGYLGTASHAMLYHDYQLTLSASSYRVVYGGTVVISGRLQNGHAGEAVTINAWPYGASSPVRAALVHTVKNGEWTFRAHPAIATAYQALWAKTELSPRRTVGVAPRISIGSLKNGNVMVKVAAGHSLVGQEVQLQHMTSYGWMTFRKLPLAAGSTAMFMNVAPATKLRAALSVNQAGVGYLGSVSRVLAHRG